MRWRSLDTLGMTMVWRSLDTLGMTMRKRALPLQRGRATDFVQGDPSGLKALRMNGRAGGLTKGGRWVYNRNMRNFDLREKRGAWICAVGLCCNLLLSAGKIALGLLFGFVSVTADGFNNLSDCGSGIVALVTFFIAAKPADREHPFGHRRAEYIASMITGLIVLFLSAELLHGSVGSILAGERSEISLPIYLILALSIAVKAAMSALYRVGAKKLDSDTLRAAAIDSLCDCLATLAVIAGAALSGLFPAADGIAGIAVSVFIIWQGARILAEASSKLLGQAPDPALKEKIRSMALSTDGVLGVHDLQIYGYGKDVSYATIHIEMDASVSMLDAHTAIDGLEMRVKRETGAVLTAHLDPVDLTDCEGSALRLKVWEQARELADGLEMHDFRLIPGTRKVEFDVGVPYGCKMTDEALLAALVQIVKSFGDYDPLVNVERE